ncbi:MauE/DoxX family redox-associated membrane protein [Mucilaginibacter lacusdianchii]|uniref:MauE/DoxX family redox-associated membrane protein n=1 Tax=Mucilaginibacter lacusdianchii TaxID=2684211 RepID=UPI00131D3F53|nr:MauE/DoxX family redox-associated membrane protein [Mucilaginibacter sp. JXJ CY 39]
MVLNDKRSAYLAEQVSMFLLTFLWVYAASSKLLAFRTFEIQMYRQAMPQELAFLVIWTLPAIEILAAILLLIPKTRLAGFYLSFVLLCLFTGYIALAVFHFFENVPCSCGGVLRMLGWKEHLIFNTFFLLLSFTGIYTINRERRLICTH